MQTASYIITRMTEKNFIYHLFFQRFIYYLQVTASFEGCVLWLQGPELTPQPLVDLHGNVLLWNGDILAGHEVRCINVVLEGRAYIKTPYVSYAKMFIQE